MTNLSPMWKPIKNNFLLILYMDFQYITSLIVRSAILGSIVFASITGIPSTPITLMNRILISVIVVVAYSLIDYVKNFLGFIRSNVCAVACGCRPSDGSNNDVFLPPVSPPLTEIPDLTTGIDFLGEM